MKLYLRKIGNIFAVDSGEDTIKSGEIVSAEIKRPRNYEFHKKYFALIDYAYGVWEPEGREYNGEVAEKSQERFRKDITVLAGYYETVINIKNEVRLEAKSISFGNMGPEEFECLYSKTIDVLLERILRNYTREDVDKVVDNIIGFA